MNDTREYFAAVRDLEAKIEPDFVFMVSLDRPRRHMKGGVVVEVSRRKAAELLADETHRLATAEESEAERANQAASIESAERKQQAKELFVAALPAVAAASVAEPTKSDPKKK